MRRLWFFLLATTSLAHDVSLSAMRQAAEAGDAKSQYSMGDHYFFGRVGLEKNLPEALMWWRKSAEQGYAPAQAMIATAYETGTGLPKDSLEAAKWYREAADQGHAAAQYNLGHMYYRGEGVPLDFSETLKLWRMSAEGGFVRAQCDLGSIYTNGYPAKGIERDLVQAYVWWSLAGSQGNEMAQKYVALLDKSMTADQKAKAMKQVRELSERMSKK